MAHNADAWGIMKRRLERFLTWAILGKAGLAFLLCWMLTCWGYALFWFGIEPAFTHLMKTLCFPITIGFYSVSAASHAIRISIGLLGVGILFYPIYCWLSQPATPSLANSRFATRKEIQAAHLFNNQGLWLGKAFHRVLRLPGYESLLAVAPTGSGKTTCLAIPSLLTWEGSMVANDMKGELYAICAKPLKAKGFTCHQFSPFG